jgi:uncharacterized protein
VAHFAGTRKLAFVIRSSTIQGKGAFATRRIAKDARIIEYLGECIDEEESDIRYPDDEMGRHHTFLFSIGDGSRVLDAGPLDWPAKYINHSCDPNCEAIEEEDGRVFISALKAIPVGAELSYDYAYERTSEHTAADEQMYLCRCGSPKCRGTIMAPPKPPKKKKKDKAARKQRKAQKKAEKLRLKEQRLRESSDGSAGAPAAPVPGHVEQHAAKTAVKRSGTKSAKKSGKKSGNKSAAKSVKKSAKKSGKKAVQKSAKKSGKK